MQLRVLSILQIVLSSFVQGQDQILFGLGSQVARCAERQLVYKDGDCHVPMTSGPCGEGQIVVLGASGVGECVEWSCKEDEVLWQNGTEESKCLNILDNSICNSSGRIRLYSDASGGSHCGCMEGWGVVEGDWVIKRNCKQIGTPCGEDRILLPLDDTTWCDSNCIHFSNCSHIFNKVKQAQNLKEQGQEGQDYYNLVEQVKETVCNRKEQFVCCLPPSMYSSSLVMQRQETLLRCEANPCRNETRPSIPWPGRKGCFPVQMLERSNCEMALSELNGETVVTCDPEFIQIRGVASSAYKSKCPRRKIWSRFLEKCVSRF